MLAASPALIQFLETGQPFIAADLYVITLANGTPITPPTKIYLTSLDRNVTYTGVYPSDPDYGVNTYISLGQTSTGAPAIQRSKVNRDISQSSKVDLEIIAGPGVIMMNQPILETIALGLWSNAFVWIRRAWILPSDVPSRYTNPPGNWNTPLPTNMGGAGDGTVVWFAGWVGAVTKIGMVSASLEVRDALYYLNRPMPKNLFSPGCYHNLYDAGCSVPIKNFTRTGVINSGSTASVVLIPDSSDQGIIGPPSWGSNPITWSSSNYQLAISQYFVVCTFVSSHGETQASAEWSVDLTQYMNIQQAYKTLIKVAAPSPNPPGATFWNIYVGAEAGGENLQAQVPLNTAWQALGDGLELSGVKPPTAPTNGYWSLGVLSVTYTSGLLNGQTVSRYIETSTWNGSSGVLNLRIPLPQTPTSSDNYTVVAGCDKRMTTCGNDPTIGDGSGGAKFGNLLHFGGVPFTPTPETGF